MVPTASLYVVPFLGIEAPNMTSYSTVLGINESFGERYTFVFSYKDLYIIHKLSLCLIVLTL